MIELNLKCHHKGVKKERGRRVRKMGGGNERARRKELESRASLDS